MTSKIHVSKQVSLCASVLFVFGPTNNIETSRDGNYCNTCRFFFTPFQGILLCEEFIN